MSAASLPTDKLSFGNATEFQAALDAHREARPILVEVPEIINEKIDAIIAGSTGREKGANQELFVLARRLLGDRPKILRHDSPSTDLLRMLYAAYFSGMDISTRTVGRVLKNALQEEVELKEPTSRTSSDWVPVSGQQPPLDFVIGMGSGAFCEFIAGLKSFDPLEMPIRFSSTGDSRSIGSALDSSITSFDSLAL